MNKEQLQERFLSQVKEKIPSRPALTKLLEELLCIEKEAVYRRLRGEVAFTFSEISLMAHHFGISVDNIISSTLSSKSKPFQLKLLDFYEPSETDYTMMEEYLSILKSGRDDPHSVVVECTNTLPVTLFSEYEYLNRLHLFKSLYQSGKTNEVKNFKESAYPERVRRLRRQEVVEYKLVKDTYYIFDPFIFQYLVNDILYYKSINLVTEEDTKQLKEELLRLLDGLKQITIEGCFKETKNRVQIYVANVNFDLSIWYVDINNYHISMIRAFVLYNFVSLDEESFDIVKKRVGALLRGSTMISVSGEKARVNFFDKQYELINSL
ncbi:helix-turn-helix domain-containing protein [Parabacteroides sp. PF5-9]|uniref:helix-turn-helix domain-containing protein n=1 Tax=Parabacteroides sp. PF5-9 TaxID=1742404 RepID=UPI00247388AA|nr:helix-turn-helix domain-containing protein [Parabacteroides sp. PF5-9]MDH6358380.1 hypothetical protein [Parabacteroides sp. PF5-9]